jgi:hypothetical protein
MNYLIHATPVHPSLCLQYFILLFTIATITVFTLLLLLLFYYCHHYKTVATDKLLRASLFPGAAQLTTHPLRLINILWLPLCWINKFRFYFPRRLLRSPILVGHQRHPTAVLRNARRRWRGPEARWPLPPPCASTRGVCWATEEKGERERGRPAIAGRAPLCVLGASVKGAQSPRATASD